VQNWAEVPDDAPQRREEISQVRRPRTLVLRAVDALMQLLNNKQR
jgi:hypothetical protein